MKKMVARNVDRGASPLPDKIGVLLQESRWLGVGAIALFLIMALWGFHRDDPGWSHSVATQSLHNPAGRAGAWVGKSGRAATSPRGGAECAGGLAITGGRHGLPVHLVGHVTWLKKGPVRYIHPCRPII